MLIRHKSSSSSQTTIELEGARYTAYTMNICNSMHIQPTGLSKNVNGSAVMLHIQRGYHVTPSWVRATPHAVLRMTQKYHQGSILC